MEFLRKDEGNGTRVQYDIAMAVEVKERSYPDCYTGLPVDNPHLAASRMNVRDIPSNQLPENLNAIHTRSSGHPSESEPDAMWT